MWNLKVFYSFLEEKGCMSFSYEIKITVNVIRIILGPYTFKTYNHYYVCCTALQA